MRKRGRTPPHLLTKARSLRTGMTEAEHLLWSRIRAHRLAGLGFRRQVPVPPHVVDFLCHEHRLVVEVDGGQHGDESTREKDRERDRFLSQAGYRVLRFWNNEVLTNCEGVLATILEAAGEPPPNPPPAGEGLGGDMSS